MEENEIAKHIVIPFLEKIGFPRDLISDYGRVPVKFGTEIKWADIVVYTVDEDGRKVPYVVVEVKKDLHNLEAETLSQVDSYAKFLDAPFFAIFDGNRYYFYHRMPRSNIEINSLPVPIQRSQQIQKKHYYNLDFLEAVERFFDLIKRDTYLVGKREYSLRNNTLLRYCAIKCLKCVLSEFVKDPEKNLRPLIGVTDKYLMIERQPNRKKFKEELMNNPEKIRKFLLKIEQIKASSEKDPEEVLEDLFDPKSELHLAGIGPFGISQFISAKFPTEFAIIEERMVRTMKEFGLIDLIVDSRTPRGYLYINEVCRQIKEDIFDKRIEKVKDDLGFPVEEDFAMVAIHEFFWEYEIFSKYNRDDLIEAPISESKKEEEELIIEMQKATGDCKGLLDKMVEYVIANANLVKA